MTEQVVIEPTPINLEQDLTEKLNEVRSKRDAISLNHEDVKNDNDNYNKVIICLSLFTAFVETIKSQLQLTSNSNDIIRNGSAIAPIFLSTLVGIISSLLKFKKFPEKMEELTKASEKCNYAITRIRELKQILNFEDQGVVKNSYVNEVLNCYRDSLEIVESSLYPDVRQTYYLKAQDNLLKIGKDADTFKTNLHKIEHKLEEINFKPISRKEEIKRTRTPYLKKDLIDLPLNYTEPLENIIITEDLEKGCDKDCDKECDCESQKMDISYAEFKKTNAE